MRNVIAVVGLFLLVVFLVGAVGQNGAQPCTVDHVGSLGLSGAHGSTGYYVAEIENHLHSKQRWFGLHGTPVGEDTIMDSILTEDTPFQIDAGNNTWGAWVQIVGGTDTPIEGTNAYFDVHRIEIVAREHNTTTYFIQIACDTSAAAALSSGDYTEVIFNSSSSLSRAAPITIQMPRHAAGTKCWMRSWALGQNTSTMDFYIGIHEYAG